MKKQPLKIIALCFSAVLAAIFTSGCTLFEKSFTAAPSVTLTAVEGGFHYEFTDSDPKADRYTLYFTEGKETLAANIKTGTVLMNAQSEGTVTGLTEGFYSVVVTAHKSGYKDRTSPVRQIAAGKIDEEPEPEEPEPEEPESEEPEPEVPAGSQKRGACYNFTTSYTGNNNASPTTQTQSDMDLLTGGTNGIKWFYNWGSKVADAVDTAASARNLSFYPMAWSTNWNESEIRAYKTKHPECEYLLAYNEPNLTDQSNKTPAQAAADWPRLKSLAKELNMKLVSPAMNYGSLAGYGDPVVWLDEFFAQPGVSVDDVCAISIHTYMDYPGAMKGFIDKHKKYGKPIWLTEFCAWENQEWGGGGMSGPNLTANTWRWQAFVMSQLVPYMELDPMVEKYAWFLPKGGYNKGESRETTENDYPYNKLIQKSSTPALTELGEVYVNLTTCDTDKYYGTDVKIDAAQYANCNLINKINTTGWEDTVYSRPTDDTDLSAGKLEIHQFTSSKWVEYQIEVPENGSYNLILRNKTVGAAALNITVDGGSEKSATLNSASWRETTVLLGAITKGKHTFRLLSNGGNAALNWIKLEKV